MTTKLAALLLALFLALPAFTASGQIIGRQPQRPATAEEQKGKPRVVREPRERKHRHRHVERDWDRDRDRDRDRHRDRDRSSR